MDEKLVKNNKYPSRYDLQLTLGESVKRTFIDKFSKARGIFIQRASQVDVANELSMIFWDNKALDEIRKAAYKLNNKKTLAGFIVKTDNPEFDLPRFFDKLRIEDELGEDFTLGPLKQGEGNTYKASLDYVVRKPGRIEFLREEKRFFDFSIEEKSDGEWKVLVECQKSSDANELKKLIQKHTSKKDLEFEQLDYDLLSSEETIKFFDFLADVGMTEDWRISDIKHLVFRRGENEEEEELGEKELSGITQAKLEGENLRQNTFVKQSEASGYRFTAMTYEYAHKDKGFVIQIAAEFKMRPKVFEVSIKNYQERVGVGDEMGLRKGHLSVSEELEIKSYFWNRAKMLFNQILNQELEELVLDAVSS